MIMTCGQHHRIQSPTRPAHPVTTTPSHPRGQHDQSPASQRVRGKRGKGGGRRGGGACSRGQHDQSAALERVRGGRGEEAGGIIPPAIYMASTTSHPHPVTRAATCEREVGRGRGGDDNDLLSRGQHDHIQSPAPQRVFHSLLEVVPSRGQGRGEGGAGRLHASAPSRLCTQRGGSGGKGRPRHIGGIIPA